MSYFSGDKKNVGINVIFSRLVHKMKRLEDAKFEINHSHYKYIKFKFVNLMGDNKDLHELLGFTGYFLSEILCRFCYATSAERNCQTTEQSLYMRDKKDI